MPPPSEGASGVLSEISCHTNGTMYFRFGISKLQSDKHSVNIHASYCRDSESVTRIFMETPDTASLGGRGGRGGLGTRLRRGKGAETAGWGYRVIPKFSGFDGH